MIEELNLTPTQMIVALIVLLIILALLICHRSHIELGISPQIDEGEENTTDYVKERYGAYIQSQGRYYN